MLHRVKSAPYIYMYIYSLRTDINVSPYLEALAELFNLITLNCWCSNFPAPSHSLDTRLGHIRMPRAVARCAATVCSFTCHLCPFFCVCENWILAWLLGKSFEQLSPHTVIINSFLGPQYSLVPALPAIATCVCDCLCVCLPKQPGNYFTCCSSGQALVFN